MDLKPPDDEMKAKASSNFSLPASSSPITNSLSNPFSVTESSPALLQPPINNTGIAKVLVLDEDSEKETDVVDSLVDAGELSSNPPDAFVPFLGAWAKPLTFAPPATPPMPATPSDFDPQYLNNLLDSFWPTLNDGIGKKKEIYTLLFPWAARMNPATRNHYRAAKPTFRLNGTPQVTISQVLSLGPENRREYVIGQFHRCSLPPGGLIHAVVNRLLGRSCRIGCRKLSESSYMFHIPHDSTREWVVQRGVWHVDDCLLFVSPWKSVNSFKVPEVSTIPVWVNLKNVPDSCYSRLGLSHVASGLGEPMQTHKPRLDPTTLGEAKLLVEVELDKPFPKQIALDDKQGNIFLVDVV
ncbi:hypothetical protein F2Q69_00008858 [Brassica cretica]|uniref:DUF4283 domain-containing protein n=1 Tax=Brassica cretica TaxID=69181 RepID=A0A8S9PDE7_BRACR|nr:hypothetical protein F2Q69_00008858 [Brassica cretica]